MKTRYFILYILFFFTLSPCFSQNIKRMVKKGIQHFQKREDDMAYSYFKEVQDIDSSYQLNTFWLIKTSMLLHTKERYFEKLLNLEKKNTFNGEVYYWIALGYLRHYDIENARLYNKKYIKSKAGRSAYRGSLTDGRILNKHITNTELFLKKPKKNILHKLEKPINTEYSEYSSIFTNDFQNIYFTRRIIKWSNTNQKIITASTENIVFSQLGMGGKWTEIKEMSIPNFKNHTHQATVQMLYGDKEIIIYADGDLFKADFDKKNHQIRKIKPMESFVNSKQNEPSIFINKEQDTLIFSTNAYSDNLDQDLFLSTKNNNNWSTPKKIPLVNTQYNEDAPFLDEEGNLFFSSEGYNSMGGYDVFKSKRNKRTNLWGRPENMGLPINSPEDDIFFHKYGRKGYFTSNRIGGLGRNDIYKIYFIENITITGFLHDQNGKYSFKDAHIIFETEGKSLSTQPNKNGAYSILVPYAPSLKIKINSENSPEFTTNLQIKPSDLSLGEVIKNFVINNPKTSSIKKSRKIELVEIKKVKKEALSNGIFIFFPFGSADFNKNEYRGKLLSLIEEVNEDRGVSLHIEGHSDSVGKREINKNLSTYRAQVIRRYLIKLGLKKNKITSYKGYGSLFPIVSNDDEKGGREINRRVFIKIVKN